MEEDKLDNIDGNIKFLKTSAGEVYGFTVGGKIYLDKSVATAETPIHEYTHLWADAMRKANPKEWQNIIGLMKTNKALWDKVRRLYPDLKTDDEIADEVLAHYSGKLGAERLREEADKIKADNKANIFDKARMLNAINNVKKALERFWKGVADWFGIHFTSAEEVADKVLSDMLNGVNPNDVVGERKGKQEVRTDNKGGLTEEQREIVEQAKANGTYMKAPNGKQSKLNEKQWVQVRTKAFKEWFGDWELVAIKNFLLNEKPVSELTGNEFEKDGIKLTDKVPAYYKEKFGGKVEREDFGEVLLDKESVKDSISHGIGRVKSSAFASVPDIIKKGIIIDSSTDWKNRGYDSVTISAPITIAGERYIGVAVVKRLNNNTNRFYLHEVVLQKNLLDDNIKTDTKAGYHQGDVAKVLQNIVSAKENCSKVVDENGEPMVVYHGSNRSNITVFNIDNTKRNGLKGGAYFTENKKFADAYKGYFRGKVYEVFLNIKNPVIIDNHGNSWTDIDSRDVSKSLGLEYEEYKNIEKGVRKREVGKRNVFYDFIDNFYDFKDKKIPYYAVDHLQKITNKLGYDGLWVLDTKDTSKLLEKAFRNFNAGQIVVFNPNQIKSATDNVGTFDEKNNDIRFQIKFEDKDYANKIGKALYRINKEVKKYRDFRNWVQGGEITQSVIDFIKEDGFDDIEKFDIKNDEYFVLYDEFETEISSSEEAFEEMKNCENERNSAQNIIDDEESTEEEIEQAEEDCEYYDNLFKEYENIYYLFRELEATYKDYSLYSLRREIKELYALKNDVLDKLITDEVSQADGIHQFPFGDIRRVYNIGDYSFHYRELDESELTEEERDEIEELGEISSENERAKDMSIKEAQDILYKVLSDDTIQYSVIPQAEIRRKEYSERMEEVRQQEEIEQKERDDAHIELVDKLFDKSGIEYETLSSEELLSKAEEYDKDIRQVLATNDGTIYGFTIGGKIYLDRELAGVRTRIHEYTHLWDKMCQKNNPELWRQGVELMKQTQLWQVVKKSGFYDNLTEDEFASEIHAILVGKQGAEVLRQMQQSAMQNADNLTIWKRLDVISKLKQWLNKFWKWVKGEKLGEEKAKTINVDDFVNMPISDLMKGTKVGEQTAENKEQQQTSYDVLQAEITSNEDFENDFNERFANSLPKENLTKEEKKNAKAGEILNGGDMEKAGKQGKKILPKRKTGVTEKGNIVTNSVFQKAMLRVVNILIILLATLL